MSNILKFHVALTRNVDADAIAQQWVDGDEIMEVEVDESVYNVDSVEIVGSPDLGGLADTQEITFDIQVTLERESGKFIANDELAETLLENMSDTFDSDYGEWSVEVSQA